VPSKTTPVADRVAPPVGDQPQQEEGVEEGVGGRNGA